MTTHDEIKVVDITEHEDGSATLSVDMSKELYAFFFEQGFRQALMRAVEMEEMSDDV
jgi:hypothetical protein